MAITLSSLAQGPDTQHRGGHRRRHHLHVLGPRREGVAEPLAIVGQRSGVPRPGLGAGPHPGVAGRVEVEEGGHRVHARQPVDDGVVELGHHGQPPAGQALHHVQLPQRAAPVEGAADQFGHHRPQLVRATRCRHRAPEHVVVEVEVGVVHQRRVVEPERHLHHPLPERGHQGHPPGHRLADLLEAHLAVPGVEDEDTGHVQVGGGRLERQERPVQTVQPIPRYRPVDPKPPRPRSLSGNSSTSVKRAVATCWMTSWAIRSPRRTS